MTKHAAFRSAALFAAMSVLFAAGCKSGPDTTSETAPTEQKKGEPQIADVDSELYWYQRGYRTGSRDRQDRSGEFPYH